MATDHNFRVKNSLEVGGTVIVSSGGVSSSGNLVLRTNSTDRWEMTTAGHILPAIDNTYDIGSSSKKVRDIYVSDGSIKMGTNTVLSVNADGDFELKDASGNPKNLKIEELELGTGDNKVILKKGSDGRLESQEKVSGTKGTARKAFFIGVHNSGDISEGTNKFYTDARVASYLSTQGFATQSNVVASIVDSAPSTLDTLNELAAALGDDANFSTTVTNSIATKLPLAGGTMTGAINMGSQNISAINNATAVSFLSTNGYWVGGVQRMNGSGNLLNIGTISSGAITSTGKVQGNSLKANVGTDDGSQLNLFADASGHCFIAGHTLRFNVGSNNARATKLYIDSVGNSVFSGTINSGAITSSGTLKIHKIGDDSVINVDGNGGYDPVISWRSDQQSSIAGEGFQIWYDNSVGDVHLHTTYANDVAAIRFHTRTGTDKATNNERFTINGNGNINIVSGTLLMGNTEIIDASRNISAGTISSGAITSSGAVSGTNGAFSGNLTVNNNLYIGDGNDGYFYNDQNGRTAFANGDFYIQDTVSNFYNYATHQYYGNSSGDNIYFRGNNLSGDDWAIIGSNGATAIGHSSGNMDTTNLRLQVAGNASIYGGSYLYFGISSNNYGSWKTRIGSANSSTMHIHAQGININNSGYASPVVNWLTANASTFSHKGNTIWNAGNDGSGSGLDADNLDGSTWATQTKAVAARNLTIEAGDGQGIGFWGGTGTVLGGSYAIAMSSSGNGNAGRHSLDSSSDYNMYFKMSAGADRGFVFKNSGSNVAAITSGGRFLGSAVYLDGSSSQNQYVAADSTHSLTIRNMGATTSGGLVLQGSSGTHGLQMYWDTGGYGFLDGAWASWDIQKVPSGTFKVDEGSGLQRVWNAGNDGSGSGLDADLLDGQHGSYYQNASNINSGTINAGRLPDVVFKSYSNSNGGWSQSNRNFSVRSGGDAVGLHMEESDGTFGFQLYGDGSNYGFLDSEWASWDLKKVTNGRLYLNNNNTYYLQPDSTSNFNTLNVVTAIASDAFRSDRWEDNGGTFLFKKGSGSGRTRHLNLADTTTDPSAVTDAQNPTGISWGQRSDNNAYYMLGLKGQYNNGYSTHSRLSIAWHTGIEIGASATYGGVRFMADTPFLNTTEIMHVNSSGGHVKVKNNLYANNGGLVWNANNDGSGSGLDADTVDSLHASSFWRSDASNNGAIRFDTTEYDFTSTYNPSQQGVPNSIRLWDHYTQTNAPATYGQLLDLYGRSGHWRHQFHMLGTDLRFRYGTYPLATAGWSSWYTQWHSGNDGSGSGLDADTLDGLQLHTGRNHDANKVVRTNSSGYIDAGWINTTSGARTTEGITRVYASDDAYIRYYTLANFGDQIASHINYNSLENKPTIPTNNNQLTNGAGYITSPNGGYADTLYRTDNRTIKPEELSSGYLGFGFTSWANNNSSPYADFLHMRSYTDSSGGNDNLLMFNRSSKNMRLWQQSWNSSNAYSSYVDFWHTGNDGSGSGLDADTVDSLHASSFLRSDASDNYTSGTLTFNSGTGFDLATGDVYGSMRVIRNNKASSDGMYIGYLNSNSGATRIFGGGQGSGGIRITGSGNNDIKMGSGSGTAWHSANDGSGSGLDADTVDGIQAADISRTNAANTLSSLHLGNNAGLTSTTTGETLRVLFPGGGAKKNVGSSETGAIKITLPVGMTNGMLSIKITVYQYNTDDSFEVHVGGYNYPTGNTWQHNPFGYITGSPKANHGPYAIRFGFDSNSKACIYIGETTTVWSYPQIAVTEAIVGYSGFTNTTWDDGWDVSIASSFENVTHTIAASDTSTVGWHPYNDGSGSGLDADLLDGQHASAFLTSVPNHSANLITSGTVSAGRLPAPLSSLHSNAVTGSAFGTTSSPHSVLEYQQAASQTDTRLAPSGDWHNTIRMGHGNPYNYYSNTLAMQMTGTGTGRIRTQTISNNSALGWRTVWDSGNDGSGSGLDADLLDGVQGASFLRSDASDTFTGTLTMGTQKALVANNYGRGVYGLYSSTAHQHVWSMGTSYNLADDGSGVGNLYGLSYTHTNVGQGYGSNSANGLGHQLNGRANGTLQWALGEGIWSAVTGNVWGASNDGSGSGLDADLLDGQHASAFLTAETNSFLGDGGSASTHPGGGRVIYSGQCSQGTAVLGMPTTNNANAFLNLNKHGGEYNSQLGFSSNGNIYYRNFNNTAINSTQAWRTIWDSGNDGSGSGLDADTLDGLNLCTSTTNNQANVVMRTDGNGYANFGWIYTASGVTSSTLTRVYCSHDGYLRYQTPANFGASISPHINYNSIANKPSIPSVGNGTITIAAGTNMSGGGSFTANQAGNTTITLNSTASGGGGSQTIQQVLDTGDTISTNQKLNFRDSGKYIISETSSTFGLFSDAQIRLTCLGSYSSSNSVIRLEARRMRTNWNGSRNHDHGVQSSAIPVADSRVAMNVTDGETVGLGVDSQGYICADTYEMSLTVTRQQIANGFGGSGSTIIPAISGKIVVVQDVMWINKATATENNANKFVQLEVRQQNPVSGFGNQTVAILTTGQWRNIQCNGTQIWARDVPVGGGRSYEVNQATKLHLATGANALPSTFTSMTVLVRYKIFDPSMYN